MMETFSLLGFGAHFHAIDRGMRETRRQCPKVGPNAAYKKP